MPNAQIIGDSNIEQHTNNSGKTEIAATWSSTFAMGTHNANYVLTTLEAIAGVVRSAKQSRTSKLVRYVLRLTKSSGTPPAKDMRFYIVNKSGVPATAPVAGSDLVLVAADAPYIIGSFDVAAASWQVVDEIAIAQGTVSIDFYSYDDSATTVYVFGIHTGAAYSYAGEVLYGMLWFELN